MKKIHILAIILIACSIAVITALVSDADKYQTFKSAQTLPEGKAVTIMGELINIDKITYEPEINPNLTTFFMKDKEGSVMKVHYSEPKPMDFERSDELTITGKIVGDDFHASKILLKCPSKYVEDDFTAKTEKPNL